MGALSMSVYKKGLQQLEGLYNLGRSINVVIHTTYKLTLML